MHLGIYNSGQIRKIMNIAIWLLYSEALIDKYALSSCYSCPALDHRQGICFFASTRRRHSPRLPYRRANPFYATNRAKTKADRDNQFRDLKTLEASLLELACPPIAGGGWRPGKLTKPGSSGPDVSLSPFLDEVIFHGVFPAGVGCHGERDKKP
jgi:hypothetical protein